jgi:hypothetical protein
MKQLLIRLALLGLMGTIAGCSTSLSDTPAAADAKATSNADASVEALASGSSATKVGELRIVLQSSPAYAGIKAKAKDKNRNGEREFQVEAENLRVGTVVSVCVSGVRAGGATANAFGNARLNLNSNAGQTVPNVSSGTRVAVRAGTNCAGALIASGQF